MVERAAAGLQLTAVGDTTVGRRRAEYGVVFCELPPREPRRSAKAKANPAAAPAPPGQRAHGTYAKAVVERCGCELCQLARTEYNRRRRQAIARPESAWV